MKELSNQEKCNNFWKFVFDVLDREHIDIESFFVKATHMLPNHAEEVEKLLRMAKKKSVMFEKEEISFKDFSNAVDNFVYEIAYASDLMKGL